MKFSLVIKSNNEAMTNGGQPEWPVMAILRDVANKLGDGDRTEGTILDANGNQVGTWKLTS